MELVEVLVVVEVVEGVVEVEVFVEGKRIQREGVELLSIVGHPTM